MDATTPATPTMISKYHVIRVLGRGGMGEVLLAEDDLGRRVAVKRPFLTASGDGLARFNIEARTATLSHPNIPVVYEMGTQEDGLPFIAMEFVEGEPLDRMITSGKPMELMLKLSIVEQICSALGYAHENNIIHRDIKPANVIVQPNGVAKIIDFGIAKVMNVEQTAGLTQPLQIIGSLHYIAPERFKAEAVDGRVDIFSAGVILYLLLTGKLPFSGGEMTASYQIVNEAHSALGAHIKDYPPALDGIMDQALAKNPDERFATAEDFADALRDVIDDLKRSKISRLFGDAERLTMESRYEPALEMLDEAKKLDPFNTQVRKLHKMVKEHQDRRKRADRLRETLVRVDSLLAAENYTDALTQLKEVQRFDLSSTDIRDRIAFVEEKKQRFERSSEALTQAEAARNRGDVTAALQIAEHAVSEDPNNTKLLAVRGAIAKQLEREVLQNKVTAVLESAQQEFGRRNFAAVETLLTEAAAMDATHPKIEELRAEVARVREAEDRRELIEEVQRRVNDLLRSDQYEQASDLLNRAIETIPTESTLHRLKMEVDTAARKFDSERFIDSAISSARQTFANDPEKAIAGLQSAIEQTGGDERLVTVQRSLRQQADTLRVQRVLGDTLRNARDLIAARQPEKAISALEAYQLEHGAQADLDELLTLARQELSAQQRRALVEKTSNDVRNLVRDERLDEAVKLLESAIQNPLIRNSGDGTLPGLLEDVRTQQAAGAHKLDVVRKRALLLRERGQLDEAIQVLNEYLATNPRSTPIQELLASIRAESEKKQITAQAIAAAAAAAQQHSFTAAFESLKSVVRAYGESEELTRANQQVEAIRSAYAQEVVGHSITSSRTALLKNDVTGAMAALRTANEMLEFAEPAKQADWRRIGQAAKKAQDEPLAAGAVIADPLADLPDAPPLRKQISPIMLISGIVAVCVILAVAGVLIFRKSPAPAAAPGQSQIVVAKAPAGAMVSVDSGVKRPTDAKGSLTVPVAPGEHLLEVTLDGYEPFTEKFPVVAGETYREPVPMVKTVVLSKPGTLIVQGNLAGFKVILDGRPRGEIMKKDGSFTLEEGAHTIRYSNEDNTDSQEHKVQIVAGQSFTDTFSLKAPQPPNLTKPAASAPTVAVAPVQPQPAQPVQPPPPSTGSVSILTNAGAQVSLNGQHKGTADGSGQLNMEGIAPGSYQVEISLDHFQPTQVPVTVRAGSSNTIPARLQPEVVVAVAAKPAPAPEPEKPAAVVDTSAAEIPGIQAALNSFVAAYKSKNMGAIQANWTNIGAARSKQLAGALDAAEVINLSESCQGQPVISGNSATQTCVESYQYIKSEPVRKLTKTITFTKVGSKWVMKDKTP